MKHVLLGLFAVVAAPAELGEGTDAPAGMVAFFIGDACPSGWQPDAVGAGRLMIATDDVTVVGRTVGTPLAPEEDRTHGHAIDVTTVDLPYQSISAADGGNAQGAASGARPLAGEVAAAPSGLPFVQLTTCVKP